MSLWAVAREIGQSGQSKLGIGRRVTYLTNLGLAGFFRAAGEGGASDSGVCNDN